MSGLRWGNAVTLNGQYYAGVDTNWVVWYRNIQGGGIGYGVAVSSDSSFYVLQYDSTLVEWTTIHRSSTIIDFNELLVLGEKGDTSYGVRLPFIPNASSLATDGNGKIIVGSGAPSAQYFMTYAQADSAKTANGLVPQAWYNITDKDIYIRAISNNEFSLYGSYVDSTLSPIEVDYIEFDFVNNHIQLRCDKRGNTVGASYTAMTNSLVSVDPISVFKWGNDLVFNNKVKDGVFNCTATDDTTLIFATTVTGYADVELSGGGTFAENTFGLEGIGTFTGNESLIANNTLNGGEFNIPNNTGTFTQNNFAGGTFTASNNSGELSGNIMYGVNSSITANNNQGRVFGNNGFGTIQANNLGILAKVAGNILVDGGTIIANGVVRNEAGCDANVVRGNSILRANGLNGKVFNNTVDGSAIVVADSTKGWIYSSLFTGSDSTDVSGDYDTSVYYIVARDSNYRIDGCVFQTFDSLVLNPSENYFFQRFGNLSVNGSVSIYDGTEGTGKVLTSDANGNATWQDNTAYGEMGFGDSVVTQALTQNVWHVVTNSNNTLWQTEAIDTHNVTYSGDSLIIGKAGTYQVNVELSVSGNAGSILKLNVFKNGVLVSSSSGTQQLSNNRIIQLNYTQNTQISVGDVLQVVITNSANSDDVSAISGNITVNRIR